MRGRPDRQLVVQNSVVRSFNLAFQRLHCYHGRLRPRAPHRYLHPFGGLPLGLFSWHRSDRFSRFTPKLDSDSRHLYAERHPASKQVSAGLYPGPAFHPGFDAIGKAHDTSSNARGRDVNLSAEGSRPSLQGDFLNHISVFRPRPRRRTRWYSQDPQRSCYAQWLGGGSGRGRMESIAWWGGGARSCCTPDLLSPG